ncbi:MAG: hypothetical protein OWU84_04385 [Firmicutes bacterium]|nr:hypothetical protein [Bacillota bacterium]
MQFRWWVVAILGLWFIASAWALSAARVSAGVHWNFVVGGLLILAGGVLAAITAGTNRWLALIVSLLAVWMGISPWTFGFQHHSKDLPITVVASVIVLLCAAATYALPQDGRHTPRHRSA